MSLPEKSSANESLVPFSSLTEDTTPLVPLPHDTVYDLTYIQNYISKCTLCNSPLRTRAEHVYIENGKNPLAVKKFFEKHFGAVVYVETIKTHMEKHCNLRNVSVSGLKKYSLIEPEALKWKFREYDFLYLVYMDAIDEIKSIDTGADERLRLQKIAQLMNASKQLQALKKERDDSILDDIDIFGFLHDVYLSMQCEDDRNTIRQKVTELKLKLTGVNQ